jgi:hypothetical protein
MFLEMKEETSRSYHNVSANKTVKYVYWNIGLRGREVNYSWIHAFRERFLEPNLHQKAMDECVLLYRKKIWIFVAEECAYYAVRTE